MAEAAATHGSRPADQARTGRRRRIHYLILLALFAFLIFLWLVPVVNTLLRWSTLAWLGLIWAYGLWLVWQPVKVRFAWLGLTALLIGGIGLLDGPAIAPAELRQAYIAALQRYEGTPYVWGGENRLGIDCSGLVRAAMIDAELGLGLRHLSPQALRRAFLVWFRDAGADTLAAGYGGQTRRVLAAEELNSLDHRKLSPGDLMVDSHGVHTMIYLGDQVWIEADPTQARVIRAKVPSSLHWFKIPVTISRWQRLEERPS